MLEHLNVIIGSIASLRLASRSIDWPHKSDKLFGDDPIEITILYSFVVLILFIIEIIELVPAQVHCNFQTLQAVEYSALIRAHIAVTRISEGPEHRVIRLESFPDYVSRHFEDNDHEGAHEVGRIRLFVFLERGIMENFVIFVAIIRQ